MIRSLVAAAVIACTGATSQAQTILFDLRGVEVGGRFGQSVAHAGDVNHDGYADVIVGSPHESIFADHAGRARVFSGKDGSVLFRFTGTVADELFGGQVNGAGDVNGDGFDDVIIGAQGDPTNGPLSGAAHVLSGKDGAALYTYFGDFDGHVFGVVDGLGDVNGDGFADFAVGAPWSDAAGSAAGAVTVYSGADGSVLKLLFGHADGAGFGYAVSRAGDVNHDGRPDLIVGALYDENGSGSAEVFSGKDGASLRYFYEPSVATGFGCSVSGAGDLDRDGFDDLVVGAYGDHTHGNWSGSAWVFSGKSSLPLYVFYGSASDGLGWAVSDAGDLDGDAYGDLIIGAKYDDPDGDGSFPGSVSMISGKDGSLLYFARGDLAHDQFGGSVDGIGDLNGDGFADVIVGGRQPFNPPKIRYGYARVFSGKAYPAAWSNYGDGWPGTSGVPGFTAANDPVVCETITISLDNSLHAPTATVLFGGIGRVDLPTAWDGRLLVLPAFALPLVLPAGGLSLSVTIPCDSSLFGAVVDLQVLESDPGASANVSFTRGLELVLGK